MTRLPGQSLQLAARKVRVPRQVSEQKLEARPGKHVNAINENSVDDYPMQSMPQIFGSEISEDLFATWFVIENMLDLRFATAENRMSFEGGLMAIAYRLRLPHGRLALSHCGRYSSQCYVI